jgi:hypothetical protein
MYEAQRENHCVGRGRSPKRCSSVLVCDTRHTVHPTRYLHEYILRICIIMAASPLLTALASPARAAFITHIKTIISKVPSRTKGLVGISPECVQELPWKPPGFPPPRDSESQIPLHIGTSQHGCIRQIAAAASAVVLTSFFRGLHRGDYRSTGRHGAAPTRHVIMPAVRMHWPPQAVA